MLIYSAFCWGYYTQDWGFALLMNTKWHAGFALQRLSKLSKHVQILILMGVLSESASKKALCTLYLTSLSLSQWGWAKPSLSKVQYSPKPNSLIWSVCSSIRCCTDTHYQGTAICYEDNNSLLNSDNISIWSWLLARGTCIIFSTPLCLLDLAG